jgi:hypothetical protein
MPESANRGRLFTVLMEFEGTSSVSQFLADSAESALRLWLDGLSIKGGYGLTDRQRRRLSDGWSDLGLGLNPTPLDGLQGAWCSSVLPKRGAMATLNIVETVARRPTTKVADVNG